MDNPFQKPGIGSFIYYDGVNSEVRDTILHIFRRAQGLYSIAVTGDPGTGKTTLLNWTVGSSRAG
jgi:Flp pilus assembly CpaF family ATPase